MDVQRVRRGGDIHIIVQISTKRLDVARLGLGVVFEEPLETVREIHLEGLVAGGVDDEFFERVLLKEVEGLIRVEDAPVLEGDAPLRVVPAGRVEVGEW